MKPAPPATRILTNQPSRTDLDAAVVADHQLMCVGRVRRPGDLDVLADERVPDPRDAVYGGVAEHDGVLDLGVAEHAVLGDRGERADIGADHSGAVADDHGAAEDRVLDDGAFLDDDAAGELARPVHGAVDAALDAFEHDAVALQHVLEAARVFPVP